MGTAGRLELRLPSAPESVAEARSRVLDALAPSVTRRALEAIRLLVSEVVTNAVRHGGSSRPVEVTAAWDGEIRVDVVDHGRGFEPAPRARGSTEPGGFGLLLVGRLAERWGVERNGSTRVWFVLRDCA